VRVVEELYLLRAVVAEELGQELPRGAQQ